MYEGWTVPIEYDPLLAKIIGYGETREEATNRLLRALYEYFVGGIKTNISLFRRILKHPEFRAGNLDTGFLDRLLSQRAPETDEQRPLIAAIGAGIFASLEPKQTLPGGNGTAALAARSQDAGGNGSPNWKRAARVEALR
jgi:acetyl-CoA carboxylase biotin carboxylase subunit